MTPYKIIPLAQAFADYPGGAAAFLPDHGDFVSQPKDAFVILVAENFISDMAGAFSHEDLLGALTYPSEDAIFSAILFKKDLHIPNACYLDYDTDYSPALIVEGNLTAKTLNLAGGQTHIYGDCTVNEVLYGHYNHGSLIVDGTTTAPLIIATDYSMTFNGAVKAEYVMSSGSAFQMNEPSFKISVLGLNLKLPALKKRFLDVREDFEQIAKIIDETFLRHEDFDDENINIALNKGDSLFKTKSKSLKRDDYLPAFVLDKLKALNAQIANGEVITTLNFTGCQLKDLPDELRSFTQAQQLIFWNNDLQKLPTWFSEYSALRHLNVSCNSGLTDLMLSPQQMAQLESLNMVETRIAAITDNETALPNLTELRFGFKWEESLGHFAIDFDWSRTPNLQHLHMEETGWFWAWSDNFSYYQLSHLTYLHHGYVVDGAMGEYLSQLQQLEYYGFITGFKSESNYEAAINLNTLKSLPNLQVLNIAQCGRMVTFANIQAIRAALPKLYICVPQFYNSISLMNIDESLIAEVPEDLPIQRQYNTWLSSYGRHQPTLETVLAAVDDVMRERLNISPHLFEEVMINAFKFVRDSIYATEDRSMRQPIFLVLNSLVDKLIPIIPKPASWTHLLPYDTYKLWELVYESKVWYLLRSANCTAAHLAEAGALLTICLPIEAKKNGVEFKDLHEIWLTIK